MLGGNKADPVKKMMILMLMVCGIVSCRYHLGAGPAPPSSFGTVAVPIFVNQSTEPNIQTVITKAIIHEFNRAGVMVVKEGLADKVLSGRVLSYSNASVARTAASSVSEYRLSVSLHLTLKDESGRMLYDNPSVQLREEYFASSILEQNEQAEAEALRIGSIDMAEDEVRHMLDEIFLGLGNDNL